MGPLMAVGILSCICFTHSAPISTVQTLYVYDDSGEVPVAEEVEFNTAQNVAIFRLPGESGDSENAVVLDFAKGVTGLYDSDAQRCYLADGLASTKAANAGELKEAMESLGDDTAPADTDAPVLSYEMSADEPVDVSLLPATLQDACAGLSVLKLKPSSDEDGEADEVTEEKRRWYVFWRGRRRRDAETAVQEARQLYPYPPFYRHRPRRIFVRPLPRSADAGENAEEKRFYYGPWRGRRDVGTEVQEVRRQWYYPGFRPYYPGPFPRSADDTNAEEKRFYYGHPWRGRRDVDTNLEAAQQLASSDRTARGARPDPKLVFRTEYCFFIYG